MADLETVSVLGPISTPIGGVGGADRSLMTVIEARELRQQIESWRSRGLTIGFVPTMGALHDGHLSLVRRALEVSDRVVVSIFVNPTQFGPGEDFGHYPRDIEGDLQKLQSAGCSLVFLPEVETLYPRGGSTVVDVTGPSQGFEGAERPGHFRGVATVVAALLNLVRPDCAVFGQKDAQQLAVIRRLVRDLHVAVDIIGAPIVRESDGLAMSSRNVYLSAEERRAARVLSHALGLARAAIEAGERGAGVVRAIVEDELSAEPLGSTDYVGVVDADSFKPVDQLAGSITVAIAYRLGATRLLDNLTLDLTSSKSRLSTTTPV